MTSIRNILVGALVATFLVACGGAGGGSAGKLVEHATKVVDLVVSNKADLGKADAALDSYIKDNSEAIATLKNNVKKERDDALADGADKVALNKVRHERGKVMRAMFKKLDFLKESDAGKAIMEKVMGFIR